MKHTPHLPGSSPSPGTSAWAHRVDVVPSAHHPWRVAALCATVLSACAAAPLQPEGAAAARDRLARLQANPDLTTRAPLAIEQAERAVSAAEQPQTDTALGAHLVFMADRQVSVAVARAEAGLVLAQRDGLNREREDMRLRARTAEADAATLRAKSFQSDASEQARLAASAQQRAVLAEAQTEQQERETAAAQSRASAAQDANAQARDVAMELQLQVDALEAKVTDRGLVLTLGDVLFAFDAARLNAAGDSHLDKLTTFLAKYPSRTALIEGYTDSVGRQAYNQDLSQRRADAVKSYLVEHGIAPTRLITAGKGMSNPIADNGTADGRQQNRRVEVVINEVAATP